MSQDSPPPSIAHYHIQRLPCDITHHQQQLHLPVVMTTQYPEDDALTPTTSTTGDEAARKKKEEMAAISSSSSSSKKGQEEEHKNEIQSGSHTEPNKEMSPSVTSKTSLEPTDDDHSVSALSLCSETASVSSKRSSTRQSQRIFDGSASMSSLPSRRSSTARPAGMRERMQQRMKTLTSERSLNATGDNSNLHVNGHKSDNNISFGTTTTTRPRRSAVDDDSDTKSVSSRRSFVGAGTTSSSVRDRLSALARVPSIRSINDSKQDDALLLLQMTQKVRQLELDKERLAATHQETLAEYESRIQHLEKQKEEVEQNIQPMIPEQPDASVTSTAHSVALELQTKLDKALSKIARLESEQVKRDDLEEKYQDAQIAIVNLQLQSPSAVRRLSMGSVSSFASHRGHLDGPPPFYNDQTQEQREETTPEKENEVGDRKPESPPEQNTIDGGMTQARPPLLPPRNRTGSVDTQDDDRSVKLEKLKAFRRSRESQLKELVLDSQHSPTDVQSVIRNLQDELTAAKEVISQQKIYLVQLQDALKEATRKESASRETPSMDTNGRMSLELTQSESDNDLTERFRMLQQKYIQLEMNRAYGEFQLRNRITSDALKFHRRLRHWKEQSQELQSQLEKTMEQQANEVKNLRSQLATQEEATAAAELDLKEFKDGTRQAMQEFSATQDRLKKALEELAKYKPSTHDDDPAVMQQAKLLETAIERRKVEQEKNSWTGLVGNLLRGDTEHRNVMG